MYLINRFFILLVKTYQFTLSPILGNQCKFYPSCSEYAIIQLKTRNIGIALLKIVWRILRCNPFSKGGVDY